jgi:pyruvate kinase
MSHIPRTKIVCTLGPATSTHESILGLMQAGMNVCRLNFSHGTHEDHAARVAMIRAAAQECGRPIAILGDLQGPRIRVGGLPVSRTLLPGDDITLVHEGEERDGEIPVTYSELAHDVRVGDRILVDDGLIELVVLEVMAPRVAARVIHGGEVKSHKGINLPGVNVSAPSITDKDRLDVEFAIEQELDYLALSFVRRAGDIEELRAMLPPTIGIIAKIEKDAALENIESILEASDGVMVARGDLGVELPFEVVPMAQKRIIAAAQRFGRPVITATQMLESMVTHPRPTRAEASDVANAILDGTDAIMLSAETAAGAYPRLAVEAMSRIIAETEQHPPPLRRYDLRNSSEKEVKTEDAIAAATVAAATRLRAPLVVVITKSGFSARVVASHRPPVPILALTDSPRTCAQLALVWGVIPHLVESRPGYTEMAELGKEVVLQLGLAVPGDRVLFTAGHPFGVAGTTNLLKVELM